MSHLDSTQVEDQSIVPATWTLRIRDSRNRIRGIFFSKLPEERRDSVVPRCPTALFIAQGYFTNHGDCGSNCRIEFNPPFREAWITTVICLSCFTLQISRRYLHLLFNLPKNRGRVTSRFAVLPLSGGPSRFYFSVSFLSSRQMPSARRDQRRLLRPSLQTRLMPPALFGALFEMHRRVYKLPDSWMAMVWTIRKSGLFSDLMTRASWHALRMHARCAIMRYIATAIVCTFITCVGNWLRRIFDVKSM